MNEEYEERTGYMVLYKNEHVDEVIYEDTLFTKDPIDPLLTYIQESGDTYIIRDRLYPQVETALKDPVKNRRFKQAVGNYVDRNNAKLRTPGPQYMIPFGDTDKAEFFGILGINEKEVTKMVIELTSSLNGSSFTYLRQNPILWVFVCCIRFYTLEKDAKGLNTALAIYALAVYPSVFHKYFKHEVSSPGVMAYTIDHLTNKFIFKQQGYLFGVLTYSIQNSYNFLQNGIIEGSDKEFIRFIQRIRNDQNSLLKKICDNYIKNHQKGLTISTALDTADTGEIIDTYVNDTSQVESVVRSIVLPIITNGLHLNYAEASAKMCSISVSEMRLYMTKILVNEESDNIEKFIESILFLWLYDEHKTRKEVNTGEFMIWCSKLFRKTNSNNENIINIKKTLDHWGECTGIHEKFKREASRVNYKRAIFFYFVLCIQYYNN